MKRDLQSRSIPRRRKIGSAQIQHGGSDFDRFVGQMMSDLADAPAYSLNQEIQCQLGHALRKFGCDRGSIGQILPDGSPPRVTHVWAGEGATPVAAGPQAPLALRWLVSQVRGGATVVLPTLDAFPANATEDRAFASLQGVKSHLAIPMKMSGIVFGSLNCATVSRQRKWDVLTIRRLTIVANVLAAAVWRKWAVDQINRTTDAGGDRPSALIAKEVTASLAHELNQPLTAILNNAEAAIRIIATPSPDLEEAREALSDIVRDDRRAVDIVRAVRGLVQGRNAQKTMISVPELVRMAEEALRQDSIRRKIRLRVDGCEHLPLVWGNRTQLLQAVINLVANALDALDEKPAGDRNVLIKAVNQGDHVSISIIDSGVGIAPRVLKTLFDPFVTSKPDGMGMGLAIARGIVKDHGGNLTAESIHGRGATFTISLPIASTERYQQFSEA